jgi:uncharacterized MnhB-related membrane protein
MLYLLIVLAAIFGAFQVMRAKRLMVATLWLAVVSALVSLLLYLVGAPEVAVIELSVGAGLVTVLFVFAFSIVGEQTMDEASIVPRVLVWVLVLLISFLLGWFSLPITTVTGESNLVSFAKTLWQQRGLDVLVQIMMIFSGVMGLLGLLSEARKPVAQALAQPALMSVEAALPTTVPTNVSEQSKIEPVGKEVAA